MFILFSISDVPKVSYIDDRGAMPASKSTDRVHSLIFDISELDLTENINHAELRLYTLIKRDQHSFYGVSRLVTIYEIIEFKDNAGMTVTKQNYITSKFVHHMENEWDSFDVSAAVKRSVQQMSHIEQLEVRIRSLVTESDHDRLDITAASNDQKQPLLVVYSNDEDHAREQRKERHGLLMHELSMTHHESAIGVDSALYDDYDEFSDIFSYNAHSAEHKRRKRSKHRPRQQDCRRSAMYVNFDDIKLDYIIAPRGYQVRLPISLIFLHFRILSN